MKGLVSGASPSMGEPGPGGAPPGPEPGDDYPARLAEAIEILAERARRRGLAEVVHLLDVAAMAARDAAVEPADNDGQT